MSNLKDLQEEVCKETEEEQKELEVCEDIKKKVEDQAKIEEDIEESDFVIELSAEQILDDMKTLQSIYTQYTKFQSLHFVLKYEKLYWEKKPFYYFKESLSIGKFLLNFKASVRYNYLKYKTNVKLNELYKVKIKVKNNKIKSISIKSRCCEYKPLRQAKKLKNTQKSVVHYLKKLSENPLIVKSKLHVNNWLQFSKEMSYQKIKEKRLFPKNEDSCLDADIIAKAKDSLLDKDFKLSDAIQYLMADDDNKTIKEIYKEDFVNDLRKELKKTKSGELYDEARSFTDTDWVYELDNMKDKFVKEKTENITLTKNRMIELFEENLEPKNQSLLLGEIKNALLNSDTLTDVNLYSLLTPETLHKLSVKSLLNKISSYDFKDAVKNIYKKMSMSLTTEGMQQMWNKLPSSYKEVIDNLVIEEVKKLFPDVVEFDRPWERDKKRDSCDNIAERETMISKKMINIDFNKIKEIYIDKIIEHFTLDELIESLDGLPGADYLLGLITGKEQMDSFKLASSFEFLPNLLKEQITGDGSGFIMPKVPQIPNFKKGGFKYILKKLKSLLIEKILDYVNSLIISIIVKMIESLENKIENELNEFLGKETDSNTQALADMFSKNSLLEILRESVCGSSGNLEETKKDLFSRLGIEGDLINNLIDVIGNNASTGDLISAILDDTTGLTTLNQKLFDLFSDSPLSDFFEDPEDVGIFFQSISGLLNETQLQGLKDLAKPNTQSIGASICLTNSQREKLLDYRKQNGLEDRNKEDDDDLKNIIGLITNGPANEILDDLRGALIAPDLRDPDCYDPDDDLIGFVDENLNSIINTSVDITFKGLEHSFNIDMIGKRNSFFDNLLADTRGIRLSSGIFSHERRVSYDLLFPNAASTIKKHSDKYEEAGFFEKFLMKTLSEDDAPDGQEGDKPFANHLFPETISIYALEQLKSSLNQNEFSTTSEMLKKGKKADYRLEFRNKTDLEEDDFDYGYDILFKNFIYKNNKYQRNLNIEISKYDLFKTKGNPSKIRDVKYRTSVGMENYIDIINQLDPNQQELNKPYVNYLFEKFIDSKSGEVELDLNDDYYDKVSQQIIKSVITGMTEDKSGGENDQPAGFTFGFIDNEITSDDLTYVNPGATTNEDTWEYTHEEEDKILGKSATGNPRVVFLDPSKYGGKYTKPKLYIEEAPAKGWVDLFSNVVPSDECKVKNKQNYLFLEDIKETVKKKQKSIPNDKRMKVDPDCVYEPAYDKLITKSQKANLEGVIKCTIRTYMTEAILRTLPAFSHLEIDFENNYNSLFIDFVVNKMEDNMTEMVDWPSKMRGVKYWLYFLDASVDMVFRLIKEKELDPSDDLKDLLRQANDVSRNYAKPEEFDRKLLFRVKNYTHRQGVVTDVEYFGSFKYTAKEKEKTIKILNSLFYAFYGEEYKEKVSSKKSNSFEWTFIVKSFLSMKYLKKITREYDIQLNRNLSKKILKYLIIGELNAYKKKIVSSFSKKPYIKDLRKYLLESEFFLNSISYGTIMDQDLGDVKTVNDLVTSNPLEGRELTTEQYQFFKENGLFFIEHYFVIKNKDGNILTTDGVKSTQEIRDVISKIKDKTKYISQVFGDATVVDEKIEGTIGIKFGVRINMVPPSNSINSLAPIQSFSATKAHRMARAKLLVDGDEVEYSESQSIIPLLSFEQDIIDRKVSDIDVTSDTLGEDVSCYLDRLVETKEFNFFFNSLLPTNKISSLVALYYYDGFIESVGMSDSEREEGVFGSRGNWREKILNQTKDKLYDMFKSSYLSYENTFDVFDKDRQRRQISFINVNMAPKIRLNINKKVKRKQLRRITYTHCEDNEEETALKNLLGD
jgi:hypothetical protein